MPQSLVDKEKQARADRAETTLVGVSFLLFGSGVFWFFGFGGVLIYLALVAFAAAMAIRAHVKRANG